VEELELVAQVQPAAEMEEFILALMEEMQMPTLAVVVVPVQRPREGGVREVMAVQVL
jgi:hypothetical protein